MMTQRSGHHRRKKKVHNNRKTHTTRLWDWVRIHIPNRMVAREIKKKRREREDRAKKKIYECILRILHGEQHTKIQRRKRKIVNGRRRSSRMKWDSAKRDEKEHMKHMEKYGACMGLAFVFYWLIVDQFHHSNRTWTLCSQVECKLPSNKPTFFRVF